MIRRIVKKFANKSDKKDSGEAVPISKIVSDSSSSFVEFVVKRTQEENIFAYPEPESIPDVPIGCVIVKPEFGTECPEQLYVYVHSMMEIGGTLKKKWYWKQISFPKNKWPETINSGAYFWAFL